MFLTQIILLHAKLLWLLPHVTTCPGPNRMTPTENITVVSMVKLSEGCQNVLSVEHILRWTDRYFNALNSLTYVTVKILIQKIDWFSFDEAKTLALEFMSYSSTHCFLKTPGIQSPTLSPLHTIKIIWIHRERAGLQNSWPLLQSHTTIWFHWDADVTGKKNMFYISESTCHDIGKSMKPYFTNRVCGTEDRKRLRLCM